MGGAIGAAGAAAGRPGDTLQGCVARAQIVTHVKCGGGHTGDVKECRRTFASQNCVISTANPCKLVRTRPKSVLNA
eukprot:7144987-Prymnesium_polylepis.2